MSMLRRDVRLLIESYKSINNKRDYKPVPNGYIYFPGDDQVFLNRHNPAEYKLLGKGEYAREVLGSKDWQKVRVATGENIVYRLGDPLIDEDDQHLWFVVPASFPEEYSFEAYIPHEIDKYKVDRETKDAWREVIGEL